MFRNSLQPLLFPLCKILLFPLCFICIVFSLLFISSFILFPLTVLFFPSYLWPSILEVLKSGFFTFPSLQILSDVLLDTSSCDSVFSLFPVILLSCFYVNFSILGSFSCLRHFLNHWPQLDFTLSHLALKSQQVQSVLFFRTLNMVVSQQLGFPSASLVQRFRLQPSLF